jgi:hypothetical protein
MRDLHFDAAALGLYGNSRTTAPAAARFSVGSRGALALLVEGLDDVRASWMLDRVEHDFTASSQAPLSALIHAVRNAFRDLAAVGQDTTEVGMTAALARGQECLFVQVPPAQAYLLHGGILRAIPQPALWAPPRSIEAPLEPPALVAPGAKWEIELETYRVSLQAGDTLVLVSSRACTRLSEQDVRAALRARSFSRVLGRLSHGRRRYEQFCALVMRAAPEGAPSRVPARALQAGALGLRGRASGLGRFPAVLLLRGRALAWRLSHLLPSLVAALAAGRARGVPTPQTSRETSHQSAGPQTARRAARAPAVLLPAPALGLELRAQPRSTRAPYPAWFLLLLGTVGTAALLAILVGLVLPPAQGGTQRGPSPRNYDLAAATLERARLAAEPAEALRLLDEAASLLSPPDRRLSPAEAERVAALRTEIEGERDRRTQTTRLGPPRPLLDLRTVAGSSARAGALAASREALFVLEAESRRVLRIQGDQVSVALAPGDRAGSLALSEPWLLVSRPAGGAYVLDRERRLVLLPLDGPARPLPLRGAGAWRRPVAVATFAANLYVLDPDQGQILRYLPAGGGFDAVPQPYIAGGQSIDLAAATAMAIDGDIWVLAGGQQVLRFRGGRQQPFTLGAAVPALAQATILFTSPESRALYLAEPERGRILQYDKNGTFERQLLAPAGDTVLTGIAALWVDEQARRLVLAASALVLEYELPS